MFSYSGKLEGDHRIVTVDFVFGVQLVDNGEHFDPDSLGSLILKDGQLDIASNQIWRINFCRNIEMADFYVSSPTCEIITNFYRNLTSPCSLDNNGSCCGKSLPTSKMEFIHCFLEDKGFSNILPQSIQPSVYYPSFGDATSIHQPLFVHGELKTLVIKVCIIFLLRLLLSRE